MPEKVGGYYLAESPQWPGDWFILIDRNGELRTTGVMCGPGARERAEELAWSLTIGLPDKLTCGDRSVMFCMCY